MGILDYLDTVRAKPEADRRRILVVWTAIGMILVVGLWLVNMLFILPEPQVQVVEEQVVPQASLLSRASDNLEKIKVGLTALKDLVEARAGLQQAE